MRGVIAFGHYAGYDEARRGRPRCRLRGCARDLRKDQRLGCCADHEAKIVAEARAILAKLEEPAP